MNGTMKRVSIITVNFNQPEVTEALLSSISKTNTYTNIEILVVDNGSKVNPVPQWQTLYPDIAFLRSEANLGFAGGNNLGINAATGDYYFLVNNDTEFTPGLIETLVKTLDANSNIGIISPKIKYFQQPDIIQYVGFTPMNYYTCANKCVGQFETDKGQYDHITAPTGFCHGAAMMLRREAVDTAGLMAENYFLYYEEMDWNDRIKRAGYEAWVCTDALIYHKESVSVGQKSPLKEYFMNRNRILFTRRNAPFYKAWFFYFYFVLLVTPRNILVYIRDKNYNFITILIKAIFWNITQSKNSTKLGYPIKTIT
jgi:GT2 family glycosyltransferase